jgi:uncharacterized protein
MTQPAKSQEPSMEEILASIRRIIADDDATKTPPHAPDPPKAAAPPVRPAPPPAPAPRVASATPNPFEVAAESSADLAQMAGANVADQSSDILDLTESMATPTPPPAVPMSGPVPQFRTIDGSSDLSFDEVAEGPTPGHEVGEHGGTEREPLISNVTSAAVDSAFNTLAQTVLVQNARTLEDLVREMLRPLLKAWLDDNLPGMVERLVRAEIERVSRGRVS